MAIRTNNKIFKSLRQNKTFVNRVTQRAEKARKERQEKLKELKLKQLQERKQESEIINQQRFEHQRALVSNPNQVVKLNRTANGIMTTSQLDKPRVLGKVVRTGVTSENAGHVHNWVQYEDGTIIIHEAKHPKDGRIKHNHDFRGSYKQGYITHNKSSCYQENPNSRNSCETLYGHSGGPMHKHVIKTSV